jgi:hypothetical protein
VGADEWQSSCASTTSVSPAEEAASPVPAGDCPSLFHCLRVTYVNRLRRAGVPREAAMRLVNHSSDLVHQIYQREKVEDVAQWRDAVQFN